MISVLWSNHSYTVNSDNTYEAPAGARQSPMDILCESLGMCIAVSLVRLMGDAGLDSNLLTVEVVPHKAHGGAPRVENMNVSVIFPGALSTEIKEKLLLQASRVCTIGNTLKRGSEITYEIKP
ncbi:OsmC family protein [Paenibacillus riograndensis]|uniref:OsmC family protein n=1 Tax=Paenibacillus riograndensis SBR5 TaxID=1073571 RepID=A0A0E4CXM9_9BACL|nr:OsmC family protein [Paenibacillus riograndensis]CQR56532.1 hypothetical protein PRIO_4130 [Paenibacillus riograndensis SBR5]